jgi:hypothetical protein
MSQPGAGSAGLRGSGGQPGQSNQRRATLAPPRSLAARPVPLGGAETRTANGAVIRTRANGARSDIYDPGRGMIVHNGLNGGQRIVVERADHSRIVAEAADSGYVQHPYLFHGQEFAQRTFFQQGRVYERFYRRYPYHGLVLDLYTPARYYPLGFYGWASSPWRAPVSYSWGWTSSPWYGYYGSYFTPYPAYASATYWLTDYLIATSLQSAYDAEGTNAPPAEAAAGATPALTPEVKAMIADEVQRDVQQETAQARANGAVADTQSAVAAPLTAGIVQRLSDNAPHVFMAGANIDLVDDAGQECAIGPGDVLLVSMAPLPAATTADATILSSKGSMECPASSMVMIFLTDLQDMDNHVHEAVDDGMAQLQTQEGQGGLPPAPATAMGQPVSAAFAAGAPAPDAMAGAEIAQQSQAAEQAETEAASAAQAPAAESPTPSAPPTISLGQPIDAVVAAMGTPTRIVDLGTKKIYVYPDLKITFQDGKVSDVQ